MSGVGVKAVGTPVFLLLAGHSWSPAEGRVVEVGALVSPALRLAWNNCSSHLIPALFFDQLQKKEAGLVRSVVGRMRIE